MNSADVEELRLQTLLWAREAYEHLDRIWPDASSSDVSTRLLREYEQIRDKAMEVVMREGERSA